MSQYKAALGSTTAAVSDNNRYRPQARQLQELFPSWSNDDLQSLLHEVGGDVELAATRISEGHAEQWGAVTRKKDKKPNGPSHVSKDSLSSIRGDFRGGRGGARGGRGGSTRGAPAPRGLARGGVRPTNGHHVAPHSPSPNAWADGPPGVDKPTDKPQETNAWGSAPDQAAWAEPADNTASATPASWGNTKEPELNGAVPQPKATAKTPATSKMSWAQIARPQEKPTPPPAPVPVSAAVAPPPAAVVVVLEPEPQPQTGWEEPTTAQNPSWEEETPVIKPSTSAADVWASTVEVVVEEQVVVPEPEPEDLPAAIPVVEVAPLPVEPEPAPPVASPSPSLKSRPTPSSHRNSARYKVTTDQAVVMPSSFGTGLEKVGMQFGSLSLGSDSSFDAPEPEVAPEPQPLTTSPPAPQAVQSVHHDAPPQASVPPTSASMGSALFQQGLPPQAQVSTHTLPSSVSQPVVSQKSGSLVEPQPVQVQEQHSQLTPQQQYMQQHMAGGYVPPHLQLQQPQHQTHSHQYSQHGLPTHIDPSQPNPQHQAASHSNYFRNEHTPAASSPYFHAPTPPAGQPQDTPYGAFAQLGGQGQHQQGAHLSGFSQEYGHDSPRGFYDTYQQSAFQRGGLGHDDVKGLSGGPQQQPNNGGLPPPAPSTGQHGNGPNAGQQQPPPTAGPQGQQYGPPVPYYYPYPQNQYYGGPYNSGYQVPPYVKYPAMFPPGNAPAPGQQAQSNIAVKGQGQAQGQGGYAPAQNLYQSGYDDYSGQPQQHSLALGQGGVDYSKQLYGGGQGFMGLGGQGANAGPQNTNPRGGSPETQFKPYGKDVGVAPRGAQQGQGQAQQQNQTQAQAGPQGQGFYGGNRFGGVGGGAGSGPQAAHLGYSQAQNDFYPYQGRQQQYWQ
ncbi:CUE domain-containing protein [Mycena chlorophos]|uniref:RNA polymerase II degradation factor 1 n=1 Tax=Mycena chlorophos TaxID=658473 RepID=A0A8H6TQ79_MYCCL|nr:CUE domain-containing protein [Mycena chlorophos]